PDLLPQTHIEGHHHHKSGNKPEGSQIGIFILLCFGDHFFYHHKDHSTSSKTQGIGENRRERGHCPGSQNGRKWFNDRRHVTVLQSLSPAKSLSTKRPCHRKTFRKILKSNAQRQVDSPPNRSTVYSGRDAAK